MQDAHGGLLVEYGPALSRGTSGVPEVPFGFVAAEGFLHPKQGEGGAPGEALGKVADLPGREAFLAVEVDGSPMTMASVASASMRASNSSKKAARVRMRMVLRGKAMLPPVSETAMPVRFWP